LLRTVRAGALATIDRNTGHPFGSLVNVASDSDGSPLILISRLSTHTANLETDSRASVLLATAGKGDPLAHPRLTVLGRFANVGPDAADEARLRRRFLARHPKAELYAGFADFGLWRLAIEAAHLVAGFGRATNLAGTDVMTDVGDAGDLLRAEAIAVAHMNDDHADAVALYATKLLGADAGPWRVTGADPEGLDLACADAVLRLEFPQRITSAARLREVLADLARQVRGR
jgi:heme oxygenase (biliverdin-IX-beta and delta-forming)